MESYFKPLRRKLGVVTLLLACAFSAGWVRSQGTLECFHLCVGRTLFVVCSRNGAIVFCPSIYRTHDVALSKSITIYNSSLRRFNIGVSSEKASNVSNIEYWTEHSPNSSFHQRSYCKSSNFILLTESHSTASDEQNMLMVSAPFWVVIFPLALFTAWLLLSTARTTERFAIRESEH